jgi:adenylate cyclase
MKALRQFAARYISLLISCAVTVAGLVVFTYSDIQGHPASGFAFVQNIELRSLDARFNLRGKRAPDPRIVIVDIDEKTLQREGAFPISRSAYARLIDRLHASGARIVAFDVTFPTPEKNSAVEVLEELRSGVGPSSMREKISALAIARDNDRRLAESMRRAGNVILGHIFLEPDRASALDVAAAEAYFEIAWGKTFPRVKPFRTGPGFEIGRAWEAAGGPVSTAVEANIKPLAEAALSYGFFNNTPDADGTMRRAFLLYRYQELDWYPSLAFQAVREYLKVPDQDLIARMTDSGLERIDFGPHTLRTRGDGSVLINFAGPYGTYPHYSMADVLAGEAAPELFRDKIVLVGPTALGIGDLRHTPFAGAFMGVEIHANVIDNLLHVAEPGRTFLVREKRQEMADLAAILVFGLLFGAAFSAFRPLFSTLAALAGLGGFLVAVTYAFEHWGMWLSFVVPAGTLLVNYAAVTSYRVMVEEREKRKVRAMFSQYVAPSVICLLEQDPARYLLKGGELKELTLMFTDIRGFTALSEELPPDEVVRLVNQHFDEMTSVLFRHWGTLDKYIGDAIMAFWGSPYPHPDHAQRGCACALEMLARMEQLNRESRTQGAHPLSMGIGLNTGPVKVGNMGSSKRLTWTALGDNVNLASRLEALTRQYDCGILLSDSTRTQVRDSFLCRELDCIRVKGRLQPVVIYELLAPLSDGAQHTELVARFADALSSYRSRNWDEALRMFDALASQFPNDGPTLVFRQRCLEFLQHAPPPDWDGVYGMKSK